MCEIKNIYFKYANPKDILVVKELLKSCKLPFEDIYGHLSNFFLAVFKDKVVGTIGLEIYGKVGLLRSLAIVEPYRGYGIARELYSRIISHAHSNNLENIFLLTSTAQGFFSQFEFKKVERNTVPNEIQKTELFSKLCSSSAICMKKNIVNDVNYFSNDVFQLKQVFRETKL